ncbi:MAG: hypothetical protein H7174_04970 [Flavobacterium sp.]|nr:hypothetical protein [Flavobacterium sp.]
MKERNLKLIDGVFSAEDAKKVLFNLINSKINHHKLDDFSNNIRFNENENSSKNRIQQLESTLLEIDEIAAYAIANNLKMNLKSNIEIVLEK